ncbi:hypothetical protein JW756_02130 [Candidatus Woesearchaeota archaeon]|nr:hypothetical protein [Candidatus Woesearchaeota archaeon]
MNFIIKKVLKGVSPKLPELLDQYMGLNDEQVEKELENAEWKLETSDNNTHLSMKTEKLGQLEIFLSQTPDEKYHTQKIDFYTPNGKKFPKMNINPGKSKMLLNLFGGMLPKGLAELANQYISLSPEELARELDNADWKILPATKDNIQITMQTEKLGKLEVALKKTPEQKYCTNAMNFYTPKGEEFPLYPISQGPEKRIKTLL